MSYFNLIYEKVGNLAEIRLNRPEVYNALNEELLKELLDAFARAGEDEEVRVVLLSAAGKAFCAGQDLRAAEAAGDEINPSGLLTTLYNPLITLIRSIPKPVISRVHGVAAGAGCALALSADIVIASETAAFNLAFVRLGLVPDSGSSWFLTSVVGRHKAFELFSMGKQINSREALELGLVNHVIKENDLDNVIKTTIRFYFEAPAKAVALIKEMVNKAETAGLNEMLKCEAEFQRIAGATEDFKEGLKAFAEKRYPVFKGK